MLISDIEKVVLDSKEYPKQDWPIPCGRHDFYYDCSKRVENMDGLFLEFGVYNGGTINFISSLLPDKTIHGFDSFEGLPEPWENIVDSGHFATNLPSVRSNVSLVVGLFQNTLTKFLEQNPYQISFVHIDCDLYSSTNFILKTIEKRLYDGSLIIFDDFMKFYNYQNHGIKAFSEFLFRNNFNIQCLGHVKEEFLRCSFLLSEKI